MTERSFEGGCMCGAIRYVARAEPLTVGYCHCGDCRAFSGAPVVVWVMFDTRDVSFTAGERRLYESSPGISWGSCPECGSSLCWEGNTVTRDGLHITEFLVGSLDEPDSVTPRAHWYDRERLTWFEIDDDLPRHDGLDMGGAPGRRGPARK